MLERKKNILITGAFSGIGLAIAEEFDSEDTKLFLHTRNITNHDMPVFVSETEVLEFDVRDAQKIEEIVSSLGNRGIVFDIIINSAGIINDKLFVQMGHAEFFSTLDTNLNGPANVIEKFLPLLSSGSSIVNIASVIGLSGNIGQSNYAASKSAIIEMTKFLAVQYAKLGIRVNAVAPGMIETKMTDTMSTKMKQYAKSIIPMRRFGKPNEVAEIVSAIARGTYLTGQTFIVDGGLYLNQ